MLVLSREVNERVLIEGGFEMGGVTVTVVEVRGNRVRLGFDAPKEVEVHREEIQTHIDAKKAADRRKGKIQ